MGRALSREVHLYLGITVLISYLPECSTGYLEKKKKPESGVKTLSEKSGKQVVVVA